MTLLDQFEWIISWLSSGVSRVLCLELSFIDLVSNCRRSSRTVNQTFRFSIPPLRLDLPPDQGGNSPFISLFIHLWSDSRRVTDVPRSATSLRIWEAKTRLCRQAKLGLYFIKIIWARQHAEPLFSPNGGGWMGACRFSASPSIAGQVAEW